MMRPDPDWTSHMPVLIKASQVTSGHVLELGMGIYSTPLLHMLCFDQDRKLVSYENDAKYVGLLKKFESKEHEINFVEDWDDIEKDIKATQWGFVFIDHKPHERRMIEARKLVDNSDFVIIHDSSDDLFGSGYGPIYPLFKYRYEYRKSRNHTVVLSNKRDTACFQ